jgi:hypothetical protein
MTKKTPNFFSFLVLFLKINYYCNSKTAILCENLN